MMEVSLTASIQAKPPPDHTVQLDDTYRGDAGEKAPLLPDLFLHDIATITSPEQVPLTVEAGQNPSPPEAAAMAKAAPAVSPSPIYIDPTAAGPGDGSIDAPFRSWHDVTWNDGASYLQKAGTAWEGNILVSGDDISIGSYGAGNATLLGSVVFDGATGGGLSGFTVRGSDYAGVTLTAGASGVTISGNTVTENAGGVWFSQTSGGDNVITGNSVSGNLGFGIALDRVATPAGHGNRIEGNTVAYNGSHGIDVYANNTLVDDNTVFGNGRLVEGLPASMSTPARFRKGWGRTTLSPAMFPTAIWTAGGMTGSAFFWITTRAAILSKTTSPFRTTGRASASTVPLAIRSPATRSLAICWIGATAIRSLRKC